MKQKINKAQPNRAVREAHRNAPADGSFSNQTMLSILKAEGGLKAKPLSDTMQTKLNERFGTSLAGVKLYENENLNTIGETAFAHGNEIHVAKGRLDQYSDVGQSVLLHEAAHVVQQGMGRAFGGESNAALEAQAQQVGLGGGMGDVSSFSMPTATASAPVLGFGGKIRAKLKSIFGRGKQKAAAHAVSDDLDHSLFVEETPSSGADNPLLTGWREDTPKSTTDTEPASPFAPRNVPAGRRAATLRPWEISQKQLRANKFNPTADPELDTLGADLDAAESPAAAYQIFSRFSGNDAGRMVTGIDEDAWDPAEVDMNEFRAKLKNMGRMVQAYPELCGRIGDLHQEEVDRRSLMSTSMTGDGRFRLNYNELIDEDSEEGKARRSRYAANQKKNIFAAGNDYSGTHELGHVLNYLVADGKTQSSRFGDVNSGETAGGIIYRAMNGIQRLRAKSGKGLADIRGKKLNKLGATSEYGASENKEMFAEAFADVMEHGAKAKKVSRKIVQEYEKLREQRGAGV